MRTLLACFFLFCIVSAQGQGKNVRDSCIQIPLVQFSYAGQLPGGDLAKRFGYNSNLALNFSVKTRKNWIFGVDFTYIFGNQIKQTMLDSITTKVEHMVIDFNGELADVRYYERGFSATAWCGKMFSKFGPNPNSGLVVNLGVGFLEHHIKIEDIGNRSPQLAGILKKGYDKLTNGPSVSEYIGYTYLSSSRFVNFFFGFEFMQAFTQDRRAWDYQDMREENEQRLDLLSGIRVGWILPLYARVPKERYYY
jgi:hypothetical protein